MIVDQFLQWVTTAAPEKRAQATFALANDFFTADLSDEDKNAAEAAMTFLLDDPDIGVRSALAEAVAHHPDTPRHIILGLLEDHSDISLSVVSRSPVLIDSELIDIVAVGEVEFQIAVAQRQPLSPSVSAAIAEVAQASACLCLLRNEEAKVLPRTLLRLTERFGTDGHIQKALMEKSNLPISACQLIIANMSEAFSLKAVEQSHMDIFQAKSASRDARERATMTLLRDLPEKNQHELIDHLIETDQMTTVFLLRVICAGQVTFFVKSLSILSGIREHRIVAYLNDRSRHALKSLYAKAGLPPEAYPAFAIASEVYFEEGAVNGVADQYRFTRIMIERILDRYKGEGSDDMDEILAMLRRFASETARDAARSFIHNKIETLQISAA